MLQDHVISWDKFGEIEIFWKVLKKVSLLRVQNLIWFIEEPRGLVMNFNLPLDF